jgi:hypothetical protein
VAELRGLAVKAQEQLLEAAPGAPEAAGPAQPFLPDAPDDGAAAAAGPAPPGTTLAASSLRRGAAAAAAAAIARAQQVAISILEPCDIVATYRVAESPAPLQDVGLDISDVQLRMSPDVMALVTNHLAVGAAPQPGLSAAAAA